MAWIKSFRKMGGLDRPRLGVPNVRTVAIMNGFGCSCGGVVDAEHRHAVADGIRERTGPAVQPDTVVRPFEGPAALGTHESIDEHVDGKRHEDPVGVENDQGSFIDVGRTCRAEACDGGPLPSRRLRSCADPGRVRVDSLRSIEGRVERGNGAAGEGPVEMHSASLRPSQAR